MYLIFTDTADEFSRIKVSLGNSAKRVASESELRDALEKYRDCHFVIIGSSIKPSVALAVAEELRISRPEVNSILVRQRLDVATLTKAISAGFRDVIDAQDPAALVTAVRHCEEIESKIASSRQNHSLNRVRGRSILVYSAKGGSGKTTISTNLASAIASDSDKQVCLVDLDLQFGDVAISMRAEPEKTISNLVEIKEHLDEVGVASAVTHLSENLDLLLAPVSPVDVESIDSELVTKIIGYLMNMYDIVIIDSAPTLNEIMLKVFESIDIALLLTTLDMPAIKNLKVALETLDAINFAPERRFVIVNRSDAQIGLSIDDVAELVGVEVFAAIPTSSEVSASTNQGSPIVSLHPRHPVSRALFELGRALTTHLAIDRSANLGLEQIA